MHVAQDPVGMMTNTSSPAIVNAGDAGTREIYFFWENHDQPRANMALLEHMKVRHLTWGEREALQEGIPTIEKALENRGEIDVNRDPSALAVLDTFWRTFNSRIQVRRLATF